MTYLETLSALTSILTLVLGTIYCYFQNGGRSGKAFLERYLSLSWVVGIRFGVFMLLTFLPGWAILVGLVSAGYVPGDFLGPVAVVAVIMARILYYSSLGHHIQSVAAGVETAV